MIQFEKKQRKEEIAAEHFRESEGREGIVFIGKAQEKTRTFRTEGRRNSRGETYPWIVESTAFVNQYYFYGVDGDFGPFFLPGTGPAPPCRLEASGPQHPGELDPKT